MFTFKTPYTIHENCRFAFNGYKNERLEVCGKDGPVAVANVVGVVGVPAGCIAVKNSGECQGFYEELIRLGIIGEFISCIPAGYSVLLVCPLYLDKIVEANSDNFQENGKHNCKLEEMESFN